MLLHTVTSHTLSLSVIKLQWKFCIENTKIVYPIAKKKVIGVTKVSDVSYEEILGYIKSSVILDVFSWTLSEDHYIVGISSLDNGFINNDYEFFLFICY